MLDLECCPFLRTPSLESPSGLDVWPELRCRAAPEPREISLSEQRERCLTAAPTRCSALLAALRTRRPDAWSEMDCAMQVVAQSCYLARARLAARAESLETALARIFGTGA